VAAAWDTTLASQIRVGSAAYAFCLERASRADPVLIAAGAVFETAYGYEREAVRRPEFASLLEQFRTDVAGEAICQVVPMDGTAALVAGQLLARRAPPVRRKDRRSKAAQRRSWLLDLQIATTCWAAGHDVSTDNTDDFEAIAEALAALYPDAEPLLVEVRPF
jgi:predicted nucleic acid-binding protein